MGSSAQDTYPDRAGKAQLLQQLILQEVDLANQKGRAIESALKQGELANTDAIEFREKAVRSTRLSSFPYSVDDFEMITLHGGDTDLAAAISSCGSALDGTMQMRLAQVRLLASGGRLDEAQRVLRSLYAAIVPRTAFIIEPGEEARDLMLVHLSQNQITFLVEKWFGPAEAQTCRGVFRVKGWDERRPFGQ
jgi:hypothetical protein